MSSLQFQSWNRYSPLPPPPVSNHTPTSNTSPVVSPKPTPSPKPAISTPSPAVPRPVPSRPAPSISSNRVPVRSPEDQLYDQLSNAARTTVDNLVLMGFNKGRVARAVQNLGSDEKEVGIFIAPLWKSGGYTGFALSFQNSLVLSFCGSVIIQMKLEYLWGQVANVDQILYEASLGWGKGCIRFWDRLHQNWFPWQQKVGKTMSPPFLCCFLSDFFQTCR